MKAAYNGMEGTRDVLRDLKERREYSVLSTSIASFSLSLHPCEVGRDPRC
jgi:hypothetical protein